MDITYTKHGDYYYPDLILPSQPTVDIGRFGRMRKKFLKEHQPDTFALMLMENTLTQHLIDIDRQANGADRPHYLTARPIRRRQRRPQGQRSARMDSADELLPGKSRGTGHSGSCSCITHMKTMADQIGYSFLSLDFTTSSQLCDIFIVSEPRLNAAGLWGIITERKNSRQQRRNYDKDTDRRRRKSHIESDKSEPDGVRVSLLLCV